MTNEEKILVKLDELSREIQEVKRVVLPYAELKKELEPIFNDFLQDIIGKFGGLDRKFNLEDIGDLVGLLLVSSSNIAEVLKTLNSAIDLKKEIAPYSRDMFQSVVPFFSSTFHGLNGKDFQELIKQTVANFGNISESLKLLNSALEFKKDVSSLGESMFNDIVEKLEFLKQKGLFEFLEKLVVISERVGLKMNEIDLEKAKPIRGIFGMLSALKKSEVQDSLGILVEMATVVSAIKKEPAL